MLPIIVTAAILRQGDTVLITRRPPQSKHGGLWEFPGGKLDPNETPQEGLRRELREELGIDSEVGDIFEVVYFRYPQVPVLILAYECRHLAGAIQNIEVSEHRWVPVADLQRYDILPADAPIIARLQR